MDFLVTSISGFLALSLILIALVFPYALRRRMRKAGPRAAAVWRWIRVHSWIGYAALALSLLHMYVSMGAGMARYVNGLGLSLATLGLLLIFVQLALGLSLNSADPISRRPLRGVHFVAMLGIVIFVVLHLALNSMMLRLFLSRIA